MASLGRRLGRLEVENRRDKAQLRREALRRLSDEDLEALEDALGAGQGDRSAAFEDLYRRIEELERREADSSVGVRKAGRWGA